MTKFSPLPLLDCLRDLIVELDKLDMIKLLELEGKEVEILRDKIELGRALLRKFGRL